MTTADELGELRARLDKCGQQHLLEGYEALTQEQQAELLGQLKAIDFEYVNHIFRASMAAADTPAAPAAPVTDVATLAASTDTQRAAWRAEGLRLIAGGKLGVLLLAGGQGTRLGSSAPKGCYNISLPSKKSLFQLQAERLLRLQALAGQAAAAEGSSAEVKPLRWYIMTSPATDAETKKHFRSNGFFGLKESQVVFFSQGALPALTEGGRIIMEGPSRLAMAPDGNGGVYMALRAEGVLADMAAHGIEAVDCYCVDNALVRLADPTWVGFCHSRGIECGARVVAKAYPEEKVGVFARRGGALEVVEYSELDPSEAAASDPATGELKYGWSNICLHYFRRDWLEAVSGRLADMGRYHIARKKILSTDGPVAGVKLELFIFDTFPLADSTALLEVRREEEFAPVKNAPGHGLPDSPDTARDAILALHRRWVEAAGGRVTAAEGVEVSPLVSYAGEGLEELCTGKEFAAAYDMHLQAGVPAAQA
ncbi:UDP-N-acetylglucosamine diphosphorylase 2-like isoform B [Chlorella sorokiniana]|uniref:UDP-N-acetylglucosamine diphosphorylase 2-like isoform B n=1 Tax=Chlorella sorokiniana TaxID=3076 RepID=A0A2P6U002_CHLSO|nr:UDP-N-acetylglucosamine diphosphorylase 2-like isoform B [Chlorella sorokiniana]|eukprot:PRW59645.1 UDP-N-acetylglucosamine diphosphorylase 2-like isoform B [Chlorella sorokiniana]